MTSKFLFAGFGGQGLLFSGKVLAYKALLENKNVSWLPSYGPEMRGGTANCAVIISDKLVGTPIVSNPDVLIAMNLPSLEKYENKVKSGGSIILDSSIINKKVEREDISVFYVPATKMATDNGTPSLANMILLGKLFSVISDKKTDSIEKALNKCISFRHADMLEMNLKAINIGMNLK